MSYVTNVMLQIGILEGTTLDQINAAISDVTNGQELTDITSGAAGQAWGGSKVPEVHLLAAAFNHLPIPEFGAALATLGWTHPDELRLMICDQHDVVFRMWALAQNGGWVALGHDSDQLAAPKSARGVTEP
jgi:hypothetical protein